MAGFFLKEKTINQVILLDVDAIHPNPAQPRQEFRPEELSSLAAASGNGSLAACHRPEKLAEGL